MKLLDKLSLITPSLVNVSNQTKVSKQLFGAGRLGKKLNLLPSSND